VSAVVLTIIFVLACIGLTAIVEWVGELFEKSDDAPDTSLADREMEALKSFERVQAAYFEASATLHDQGGSRGQ
jgi:hypothetical protein